MMFRYPRRLGRKRQGGFTLVEIMLVVVILLTLAAVVVPKLAGKSKTAKIGTTKVSMSGIKTALGNFEVNVTRFPTTEEGLTALITRPNDIPETAWGDQYLENMPKDAWGNDFKYTCPSEHGRDYDLVSPGPDGKLGTPDDITNYADENQKSGGSSPQL